MAKMKPTLKTLENWATARADAGDTQAAAVGRKFVGLVREMMALEDFSRGAAMRLIALRVVIEQEDLDKTPEPPRQPRHTPYEPLPSDPDSVVSPGLFGAAEAVALGAPAWPLVAALLPPNRAYGRTHGSQQLGAADMKADFIARMEYGLQPEDRREAIEWRER